MAFITIGVAACNGGSGTGVNPAATSGLSGSNSATAKTSAVSSPNNSMNNLLTQANLHRKNLKDNYETPVRLGFGFDDRTGMSEGLSCLVNGDDPNAIVLSDPQGSIDFTDSISAQEVGNLLSAGIEGKSDFGLFTASLKGKYVRDSMDTRQSIHFSYVQTMSADATFTIKGIGNDILSQDAQNILAKGMDAFTAVCGGSIVQSAKEGAVLLVDVSIQFANASQKEKFEGEASGSISGIGSIKGAFERSESTSTKNATFAVKAYQLGGDPTKLAKIFGNPDPNNQYNIVKCNSSNLDACQDIINDVIGYAQNDFQTSVNFKNPSTLYTYEYNTKTYQRLGVQAFLPPLTPEEQAAKDYLTTNITQDRQMLDYLNTYQQQSFFTSVDDITKRNIVQAAKDYTTMVYNYNNFDIIDSCYGDTNNINTRCVSAASQVKDMRGNYLNSIQFANNMAIAAEINNPLGPIIFIPVNAADGHIGTAMDNIYGYFVAYSTLTQTYSTACYIDTTSDNGYFKKGFPKFVGKSVYCPSQIAPEVNNFYVRDSGDRRFFGIAGHIVNGTAIDYPVPNGSFNAEFFYSDGSNFKYNPI